MTGEPSEAPAPPMSWRVMVSIRRAYDEPSRLVRHPLPTAAVVASAASVAAASWIASGPRAAGDAQRLHAALAAGAIAIGLVIGRRDRWRTRVAAVLLMVVVVAALRADSAWSEHTPRQLGPYHGWAVVVGDPQPAGSATRAVLAIDGERFEHWARGRARRMRVATWESGDRVLVQAVRLTLPADRRGRVAWQHVVGQATVEWVADHRQGTALDVASGRVRAVIDRASQALPGDHPALFRGLVIGDDAEQPASMVARFRASGLSHLTAVSGQNVAFVLAVLAPLLRTLRPIPRWLATLTLIGWFAALTRFEPSIMRAGAMAALSATAFLAGVQRSPLRLLAIAVGALLLIDPLLVTSIGLWLSIGATAGVCTLGGWLSARLSSLGLLAAPLGVTLGAQAGVAVPALLVFGRLPIVSVPANLLAVPVAGAVMMYGLPASLLAGALPASAPVVMLPCRLGVAWIDLVARLGAHAEPGGRAALVGWALVGGAIALAGIRARRPPVVESEP